MVTFDFTKYETAIKALNQTRFEELVREIIEQKYSIRSISHIGKVVGKQKSRQGTPDIWIIEEGTNHKRLIEVTTQETGLLGPQGKIQDDLNKCKRLAENKIIKIDQIIYACTSKIGIDDFQRYEVFCKSFCQNNEQAFIFWGIDDISYFLKKDYRYLATKYLGICSSSGSILDVDEYVKVNNFGIKEDNPFSFREKEKQTIIEKLYERRVSIVYGPSGCGKTRLALEVAKELKTNKQFNAFCIRMCNINTVNELQQLVKGDKKTLFLIDDANRIKFIQDVINFVEQQGNENLFVLCTVRDYAKDQLEKSLKNNFYNLVPVQPLTEEQIKEIIKQSYGIVNDKWLRTIIDVSKGNLRFALMTSDVLISEDKTEKSICDILKKYYKEVNDEIDQLKDEGFRKALVAISFMKKMDVRSKDKINALAKVFKFDEDLFIRYCDIAEENELINYFFDNNAIEIADQILADYLFYDLVFQKKEIKFVDIFNTFYDTNRTNFIDMIQSLIYNFGANDKSIREELDSVEKDVLKQKNEKRMLDFFSNFSSLYPEDCLSCCKEMLKSYNEEAVYDQMGVYDLSKWLNLLNRFFEDPQRFSMAISLLYDLLQNKNNLRKAAIDSLPHFYGISRKSYYYKYQSQIYALKNALNIVEEAGDYYDLLYKLIEIYYPLIVQTSEETQKNSITLYTISYYKCDEFVKLRKNLWLAISKLIKERKYISELKTLFYKNSYGVQSDYQLRVVDKEYAKSLYNEIEKQELSDKIFCYALLHPYKKMDDIRGIYVELADDPAMKLYMRYISHDTKIYNKDVKKEIESDLAEYANEKNVIADLIAIDKVCTKDDYWKYSELVNTAFSYIQKKDKDKYYELLIEFLSNDPQTDCQPLNIVKYVEDKTSLLLWLNLSSIAKKVDWISQIYFSIDQDEITDEIYESAFSFFTSEDFFQKNISWGNEQLLKLQQYEKYKRGFLQQILKSFIADNRHSYHFIEGMFHDFVTIEELLSLFNQDDGLLISAYFLLLEAGKICDTHATFLKYISLKNEEYLFRVVGFVFDGKNRYISLKNLYDIPFFCDAVVKHLSETDFFTNQFSITAKLKELDDENYLTIIDKFIKINITDQTTLAHMAWMIGDLSVSRQISFLDKLINNKISEKILESLHLFSGPHSWSGSELPYLKEYLEALVNYMNQNDLKKYSLQVNKIKERLSTTIRETEIYDFNNDIH